MTQVYHFGHFVKGKSGFFWKQWGILDFMMFYSKLIVFKLISVKRMIYFSMHDVD